MKPSRGFSFADPLRLCAFAVSGSLALAAVAHAAAPLGIDDARHLLNRTSFSASVEDISAFAKLTREQAVERLLAWTRNPRVTPPPAWVSEPFQSPRRPRENLSNGTDHGTANALFVLGGRVRGGLYGLPPGLARFDGNGNPPFAVDFRDLYATVLERWWGVDAARALNGRFAPLGCPEGLGVCRTWV